MYVPMRGLGAGPDGLGIYPPPARQMPPIQAYGEGPPLAKSPTGSSLFDAVMGAALGYALAPKPEQRVLWAAAGAAGTGLAGSVAIWGMAGLSIYMQMQRRA